MIIGLAGSNSSTSINKQLVTYTLGQIPNAATKILDLTAFAIPMYAIDIEENSGIPQGVQDLLAQLKEASALVIAVNEHNGGFSAFFKNIVDWLSRADRNFLEGKPVLLMSTSPGARGAQSALQQAQDTFPRFGGKVVEAFSFPSFYENFKDNSITHPSLEQGVAQVIASFMASV